MNFKIATLPGDGIGPEVVEQAVKSLRAIEKVAGHSFELKYSPVGAIAIDETGDPFPEDTFKNCQDSDAVLFGAIGHPKYDNDPKAKVRPEQGLLRMRKDLGLFANIRPVKTFEHLIHKSPLRRELIEGADFVVIRELTGGVYFGARGRSEDLNSAFDTMFYSRYEIERIVNLAFDYARNRSRKLTLVDKANVLASSRLWREVTQEMVPNNTDVDVDYLFVDNAAMQIIQWPKQFDVMVTSNLFGDILSDESSVITGSLGLLPSASIGTSTSVFEPVHGSYPQGAGKDIANPIATILSAAMMLDHLKLNAEADMIRAAVDQSMSDNYVTEDLDMDNARKCSEVGDYIQSLILKNS